jgi:hypothetical protein
METSARGAAESLRLLAAQLESSPLAGDEFKDILVISKRFKNPISSRPWVKPDAWRNKGRRGFAS